jgi:hypothetical protein
LAHSSALTGLLAWIADDHAVVEDVDELGPAVRIITLVALRLAGGEDVGTGDVVAGCRS